MKETGNESGHRPTIGFYTFVFFFEGQNSKMMEMEHREKRLENSFLIKSGNS